MDQDLIEIIEKFIMHLNPFLDEGDLNWRADGRLEVICPHGVGHTVWSPRGEKDFVHGCDGCCQHFTSLRTIVDVRKKWPEEGEYAKKAEKHIKKLRKEKGIK